MKRYAFCSHRRSRASVYLRFLDVRVLPRPWNPGSSLAKFVLSKISKTPCNLPNEMLPVVHVRLRQNLITCQDDMRCMLKARSWAVH